MGCLMDRHRIIMTTPTIHTASGATASFLADRAGKLAECKVTFLPSQSGSGDPSPSNIRAISGYSTIPVVVNGSTVSASLGNTYYGGYIDLISGSLTVNRAMATFTGESGWSVSGGTKFYTPLSIQAFQASTDKSEQYSNLYPFDKIAASGSSEIKVDKHFYLQRQPNELEWCRVWVYDTGYTLDTFKTLLNTTPLQVTYPIVPQTYQLTPQTIKTIAGQNSISSVAGNIEVKYYSH